MPSSKDKPLSLDVSQISPQLRDYWVLLNDRYGTVPYLCYGYFEDAAEVDLQRAQHKMAAQIKNLIAMEGENTVSVLVVGATWKTLADELYHEGCQVDWLVRSCDTEAGSADRSEAAGVCRVDQPRAESSYDRIILEGTFEYEAQLRLLNDFRDFLTPQGRLCVANEFLLDDSAIEYSPLANCSSFEQLAARLGYTIESCQDLSDSAQRSIRECLDFLAANEKGAETPEISDTFAVALEVNLAEYRNRRRSFRLYSLSYASDKQTSYPKARFSSIENVDGLEIREVFEQSFGVDFDLALWRWKYLGGDGKGVVARLEKGGDIIAHYGGAPRKIDYFGMPSTAIQVCDVMVLPEKRTRFGRSSLFFKTACTFLEREIGNTVKHLLGFGFPNRKAMNIALRLGLYHKTDDLIELRFDPAFDDKLASPNGHDVLTLDIELEQHRQWIDALWEKMRLDFREGIIGVRDADYMRYRYFAHPGRANYRSYFLFAESSSEPRALAVFKKHEGSLLLMDLLSPLAEMQNILGTFHSLHKNQLLGTGDCTSLKLWLTKVPAQRLMREGMVQQDLGIAIPCNSWNPGPPVDILYGKWWLTAGDMDFM